MTDSGFVQLDDARRLEALRRSGLDADPDASFDRFADLARTILHAPVALVSLVDASRQYFPGAVGVGLPWCDTRQTPLSHSFCQIVATTSRPLVIEDARADPRVRESAAITDLGVIAYAGIPLSDDAGNTLGSLCVIDHEPRAWTSEELAILATLAEACAAELRLRITMSRLADTAADRDRWASQLGRGLQASEAIAAAGTLQEIADAVGRLVPGDIPPVFAAVGVLDPGDGLVHLIAPASFTDGLDPRWRGGRTDDTPLRRCVLEGRPFAYDRQGDIIADFPALATVIPELGWQSLVCVPMIGDTATIGALVFAWAQPHAVDLIERSAITTFTGYATEGLQRIRRLTERIEVAETLQRAMLTRLPEPDHLHLAARYHPAHDGDQVGGDWYDAFLTPGGDTMLVIGDVAGHDIAAAAIMGQLRSMLRAYAVDRDESPADLISRLDRAAETLNIDTTATIIAARIHQTRADAAHGLRHLSWSNAGHPPPLLISPDGKTRLLQGRSPLIGLRSAQRETHTTELPPGSTVIFYTDGLVERRGRSILDGIEDLRLLSENLADLPLPHFLDRIITEIPGPARADDIALLGCRLYPEDQPRPAEAGPERARSH